MPDDKIIMEYRGPFVVKLEYFKDSGKFYSEGEYQTTRLHLFEIFEEIDQMLKSGKRPGLVDGANEFFVRAEVPDHPHNHPALFIPENHS